MILKQGLEGYDLPRVLELMRQLEKEEFKLELPAVICGDFNSEPTSAV